MTPFRIYQCHFPITLDVSIYLTIDFTAGWWRYDERTSADIEAAYLTRIQSFDMLICGELYVINFEHNYQHRKYGFGRKRTIKRDKNTATALGIAGCRY